MSAAPKRTWKQRLLNGAGVVFLAIGVVLVLASIAVFFGSGSDAGFSVLVPGLAVTAAGVYFRGYARGDSEERGTSGGT